MKDGIIQQIGTPKEVYETPENIFVGGFIGSPAMNFFNGKLNETDFVIDNSLKFKVSRRKNESSSRTRLCW